MSPQDNSGLQRDFSNGDTTDYTCCTESDTKQLLNKTITTFKGGKMVSRIVINYQTRTSEATYIENGEYITVATNFTLRNKSWTVELFPYLYLQDDKTNTCLCIIPHLDQRNIDIKPLLAISKLVQSYRSPPLLNPSTNPCHPFLFPLTKSSAPKVHSTHITLIIQCNVETIEALALSQQLKWSDTPFEPLEPAAAFQQAEYLTRFMTDSIRSVASELMMNQEIVHRVFYDFATSANWLRVGRYLPTARPVPIRSMPMAEMSWVSGGITGIIDQDIVMRDVRESTEDDRCFNLERKLEGRRSLLSRMGPRRVEVVVGGKGRKGRKGLSVRQRAKKGKKNKLSLKKRVGDVKKVKQAGAGRKKRKGRNKEA